MIHILNLINKELKQLQPSVQIETSYGNRGISFNGVTPRLIWSFTQDNFTATRHLGMNPHQIKSMEAGFKATIYHKSPEEIYGLINDLICAIHLVVLEPSIKNLTGHMADPGDNAQNGYGYELDIVIDTTIVEPKLNEVIIQNEDKVIAIVR